MPKGKTKIRGFHGGSQTIGTLVPYAGKDARVPKREAVSETLPLRYARMFGKTVPCGVSVKRLLKSIFPQKQAPVQTYSPDIHNCGDCVFDFTRDVVRRNGKVIRRLGAKSAPLAKVPLHHRGKRISYETLAEFLGDGNAYRDGRTSYNYRRSIDKIYERLNRDCGQKIFHCQKDTVIVLEPCR